MEKKRLVAKAKQMLDTNSRTFNVDAEVLARANEALVECANICTQSADACMSEEGLSTELAKCIPLNLDCAVVCAATSRVVSRQTEYDANVTKPALEACAVVCKSCGDERECHGHHMARCRICAEGCRRCEQACRDLLGVLLTGSRTTTGSAGETTDLLVTGPDAGGLPG